MASSKPWLAVARIEIQPQREAANAGQRTAKRYGYRSGSQEGGEDDRVRESSMAPKVAVADAEIKPNDIEIGNDGTHCPNRPDSFGNARGVEASSNAESGYRM